MVALLLALLRSPSSVLVLKAHSDKALRRLEVQLGAGRLAVRVPTALGSEAGLQRLLSAARASQAWRAAASAAHHQPSTLGDASKGFINLAEAKVNSYWALNLTSVLRLPSSIVKTFPDSPAFHPSVLCIPLKAGHCTVREGCPVT